MDKIKLQNLITELREEVQNINAKIDALEAELHCSEPDEAEEIPFDVPRIEDEELTPDLFSTAEEAERWFNSTIDYVDYTEMSAYLMKTVGDEDNYDVFQVRKL